MNPRALLHYGLSGSRFLFAEALAKVKFAVLKSCSLRSPLSEVLLALLAVLNSCSLHSLSAKSWPLARSQAFRQSPAKRDDRQGAAQDVAQRQTSRRSPAERGINSLQCVKPKLGYFVAIMLLSFS